MAHFNHAFKKTFIATKTTQVASNPGTPNGRAGVTNGILTSTGIHVSNLKSTLASEGYQLGPGVVGLFDAKTNLSVLGAGIASGCCPFYLAAASLKTNDKIGPFQGGYQESNKSKVINPKYIRKVYRVDGNTASQAITEVGEIIGGGAVATVDNLVGGTGYTTSTDVPTTGGTGTGLTVDITAVAGVITVVAINEPGTGYLVDDTITITTGNADATIDVATVAANACAKEFLCGEKYYLQVRVKGTPALRFANHHLYQNILAQGGCCADPSNPTAVESAVIYKQWANGIAENPYLSSFVRPILVIDGTSYFYTAADATAEGGTVTNLFTAAPDSGTIVGLILKGAYVDTTFGNCTFEKNQYYGIEPIQIYASEVDLNGDPCTFGGVCVNEACPGIQAMGTGEEKVRDLILSESYLQNFMADDKRIREITQGTVVFDVLDRTSIYSSMYILHSVPRFNNPTGVFDNDQYLLEVVGTDNTMSTLQTQIEAILADCAQCGEVEDYSQVSTCGYRLP